MITRKQWPAPFTGFVLIGLVIAGIALIGPLAGSAEATGPQPRPVKVMTRNLYLGTDLTRTIAANNLPELLAANAQNWSNVQQTNFPERAGALAREIADADPTLIGLQEVERWYSGPLGDPAPATDLEYDYLAILRRKLAALGVPYDVVKVQPHYDVEGPAGAPYYRDFRLVDQDAILVKSGLGREVSLTNAQSGQFSNNLTVTTGTGAQVEITRGWVSVDVTVNKRSFRFVDTHLDSDHPGIRYLQAQELTAASGPVGSAPGKVILVGDMNSGPDQSYPENLAFSALAGSGLVDTWAVANPGDPGPTWGFSELLNDPSAAGFDRRIDHVLTKGAVGVVGSRISGTEPDNRTADGLWPSDHAGVVATLAP